MEEQNKIAALEAVLFTIGDSVEVGKLAEVIGEDVRTTKKLLARLQERYEKEDSGIMLSVLENAYQLCSKPAYYESLIKVVKAPRKYILTDALLDFELITEVGRKDAPGRPILFGTTEQFLRSFGVKSLTELPELNPDRMAQFREEAEKEVQLKLDI